MKRRHLNAARAGAALVLAASMLAAGRIPVAAADPPPPSTTTTGLPPAPTTTSTSSTTAAPTTAAPTTLPPTTAPPPSAPPTAPPTTGDATVSPPTAAETTTTTTGPTTTTTTPVVDPAKLAALVQGLDGDLARAQAIAAYQAARAAAAQLAAGQTPETATDPVLLSAAATQLQATADRAAAQERFDRARGRINQVAVALYVGEQVPGDAGPLSGTVATRSVMLSVILEQERAQLRTAHQELEQAKVAFDQSRRHADDLVNARATALEVKAVALAAAATTVSPVSPSVLSSSSTPTSAAKPVTTLPPELLALSPTILGASVLTAGEILGWYAASQHQPQLTVPLPDLVKEYQARGAADGVRADMAFAQAVLETGYLSFPSYGQVSASDNNFAGIGACDRCASGSHFPDAATGVAAHLQLLHAYATTAPLAGPLPGPFWVSGCCQTWLGLTGVWATAPTYGFAILRTYRSMVAWALAHRSATAGL